MVPRGDRSGAVLEPYLTDQWYVKIAPLASPGDRARSRTAASASCRRTGRKTYFEWMRNIKDWCISRQLWWGHRIPAWYDAHGNIYVGRSEAEVRAQHQLPAQLALRQDEDVLDTWFSSALWPFSTLGLAASTPASSARFYPSSVLVTGFDIIFFWVARMMMMGLKFMGDVPFREVYITGLIRDEHGQKMSKSKGNVIDPLDIVDGIDARGTGRQAHQRPDAAAAGAGDREGDAQAVPRAASPPTAPMRCASPSPRSPRTSRDIRFDLGRVGGYRNFCNKLWNAARFVTLVAGEPLPADGAPEELSVADRWIRSRLGRDARRGRQRRSRDYRFDFAASALYEFTWYEFCDWYLELTKPVLQSESATAAAQARHAAHPRSRCSKRCCARCIRCMPFITEEIWQRVAPLAGPQRRHRDARALPARGRLSRSMRRPSARRPGSRR